MVSGSTEHTTQVEAAEVGWHRDRSATPSRFRSALERRLLAAADAAAYSSALAAVVGATLTLAAGLALSAPGALRSAALVFVSTFFVYGFDRLRDLPRDRSSSPARSRFVERHQWRLVAATAAAAVATLFGIATSPEPTAALCLAIGGVGLAHRRLKAIPSVKVAYVALAWTAACVGVPALDAMRESFDPAATARTASAIAVFVATGLAANLIASNLRSGKQPENGWRINPALATAHAIAAAGVAWALIAPTATLPLAAIPAAEALAIARFRTSERYAHLAVDGALAIGGTIAIAVIALRGMG